MTENATPVLALMDDFGDGIVVPLKAITNIYFHGVRNSTNVGEAWLMEITTSDGNESKLCFKSQRAALDTWNAVLERFADPDAPSGDIYRKATGDQP